MRTAYHEQLSALTELLGEMCGLSGKAMERATQALLQADLVLAEQVITDHDEITAMSHRAEESAFVLLALQAPVAGERMVNAPPTVLFTRGVGTVGDGQVLGQFGGCRAAGVGDLHSDC